MTGGGACTWHSERDEWPTGSGAINNGRLSYEGGLDGDADINADAEKLVPGSESIESAPSGIVRIKESTFKSLASVALVLVTVIVYTSDGSSLLLLKRTVWPGASAGRYASDCTVTGLPCQGRRVIGINAGGDAPFIAYPTKYTAIAPYNLDVSKSPTVRGEKHSTVKVRDAVAPSSAVQCVVLFNRSCVATVWKRGEWSRSRRTAKDVRCPGKTRHFGAGRRHGGPCRLS